MRLTNLRAASVYQVKMMNNDYYDDDDDDDDVYQVMIATENSFGMNTPQNIFTFATKGAGEKISIEN